MLEKLRHKADVDAGPRSTGRGGGRCLPARAPSVPSLRRGMAFSGRVAWAALVVLVDSEATRLFLPVLF